MNTTLTQNEINTIKKMSEDFEPLIKKVARKNHVSMGLVKMMSSIYGVNYYTAFSKTTKEALTNPTSSGKDYIKELKSYAQRLISEILSTAKYN